MAKPKLPSLNAVLAQKNAGKQSGLPSLDSVVSKNGTKGLPSLGAVLNHKNAAKAAPTHHSGGILHAVEHVAGQTATDLYNTAVHSPKGLYETGKAVAEASLGNYKPIEKIGKVTAEGTVQDFKHPLRHPGNTALDVGSVLSLGAGTAARVGEVGRALEAGEGAGSVVRGALKGPKPEARVINYDDAKINAGTYSRSALRRSSQKLFDAFQQRYPDVRLPLRNLHERVGHELTTDRRITDALGRAPAHALAKSKLSLPKQKALQVVAEGVPIGERVRFHEQILPTLKGKLAASTRKEIASLNAARKYVVDVNGMPRIHPGETDLAHVYEEAKGLAQKREQILGNTPKLVRDADGKVVREQALTADTAAGRLTGPAETMGHTFDPNLVPELFRFPYASKKALPALGKMAGYKGGIAKTPGSLKKTEYALLKSGAFRNDTTHLVAESYLEAHRFAALMRHRDEFLHLAHDEKTGAYDIPIRTDALLNRAWPKVLQDLSEKPALTKGDVETLGRYYDDMRGHVFPSEADVLTDEHTLAAGQHPQVKWIDKRVLGGLNEPNPLVGFSGSPGGAKGIKVFDAINNASRAAILYLKPAYAVPNILGNAALNIVQQGFGAPLQVAKSARLWAKLDRETRMKVKLSMGEGVSGSLHSEAGIGNRAINKMAELWQGPVDTPFRVNAFFYEARRGGYKTVPQIRQLFDNETELLKVAREASSAVIDYGRLGPLEQNVIRRIIFFYPWVKGSSVYAARFLTTHHTQAAALGQLGKQGAAQDAADLGPLPSYAEGLFKVGERHGMPLVLNPNSAGILQTPADLLKSVQELAQKHPGEAFSLAQNFTPAIQAALTLLAGQGQRPNETRLGATERTLVGGLPALTTAQQLLHPPSESAKQRVYPRNERDVLLHFLVGGLAPTPLNKGAAQRAKYREDHPH